MHEYHKQLFEKFLEIETDVEIEDLLEQEYISPQGVEAREAWDELENIEIPMSVSTFDRYFNKVPVHPDFFEWLFYLGYKKWNKYVLLFPKETIPLCNMDIAINAQTIDLNKYRTPEGGINFSGSTFKFCSNYFKSVTEKQKKARESDQQKITEEFLTLNIYNSSGNKKFFFDSVTFEVPVLFEGINLKAFDKERKISFNESVTMNFSEIENKIYISGEYLCEFKYCELKHVHAENFLHIGLSQCTVHGQIFFLSETSLGVVISNSIIKEKARIDCFGKIYIDNSEIKDKIEFNPSMGRLDYKNLPVASSLHCRKSIFEGFVSFTNHYAHSFLFEETKINKGIEIKCSYILCVEFYNTHIKNAFICMFNQLSPNSKIFFKKVNFEEVSLNIEDNLYTLDENKNISAPMIVMSSIMAQNSKFKISGAFIPKMVQRSDAQDLYYHTPLTVQCIDFYSTNLDFTLSHLSLRRKSSFYNLIADRLIIIGCIFEDDSFSLGKIVIDKMFILESFKIFSNENNIYFQNDDRKMIDYEVGKLALYFSKDKDFCYLKRNDRIAFCKKGDGLFFSSDATNFEQLTNVAIDFHPEILYKPELKQVSFRYCKFGGAFSVSDDILENLVEPLDLRDSHVSSPLSLKRHQLNSDKLNSNSLINRSAFGLLFQRNSKCLMAWSGLIAMCLLIINFVFMPFLSDDIKSNQSFFSLLGAGLLSVTLIGFVFLFMYIVCVSISKERIHNSDKACKYARLKAIAHSNQEHELALKFTAKEHKARRYSDWGIGATFIDYLMELSCNYGQSITRPLIGLILINVIAFSFVDSWFQKYNALAPDFEAPSFVSNALGSFSASSRYIRQDLQMYVATSFKKEEPNEWNFRVDAKRIVDNTSNKDEVHFTAHLVNSANEQSKAVDPKEQLNQVSTQERTWTTFVRDFLTLDVIYGIQSIFSIFFIFLIGLGIRNRYKI